MSDDVTAIVTLLYRYGALMDAGDFDGAADLLSGALIRLGEGKEILGRAMAPLWRDMIILYPCGTPRTQHMISNPIVELDATGALARCTALYTVYQQTDELPLQPIAAGRYEDEFVRDEGGWRFSFRDYTHFNFKGGLSHHLRGIAG